MASADVSMELDPTHLDASPPGHSLESTNTTSSLENGFVGRNGQVHHHQPTEAVPLLADASPSRSTPPVSSLSVGTTTSENYQLDAVSFWQTLRNILERCFQPPVIGAVAGILVAILPGVRGIFVDLVDRDNSAPLQFLFDGLYAVGQTAVPINMMILGCNLSSSTHQKVTPTDDSNDMLSMKSMIGIVIGKMVVMPMVGILSALFLKTYVLDIPDDIDGAFYLVLMIVFLTPTANNVIIMVELSGSAAKEGMARVIALQYLVAPLILSLTMTIAIGVASGWS
jgi:predicted permease